MHLCRVHGTRVHASEEMYALSRSSTESRMDAGIPQTEAHGKDGCARVSDIRAFCRACTRAFTHRVADTTEIRPPTLARDYRARGKSRANQV